MFLYQALFRFNKGFTIIETVISLFVLFVAVIGVYSAFSLMLVTTGQMSDRFVASYLAQEGMEIARNIRDRNWLQPPDTDTDWTAGLFDCGDLDVCEWQADYTVQNNLDSYNNESYLNLNSEVSSEGFYYYDLSNPNKTRFRRKISVEKISDYIMKVSVTVFWDEKATIFNFENKYGSITVEDYLYNWY